MPVAGIVTGRFVQPKWLVAGALILTGVAMLHMSTLTLQMDFWTVARARVLQAMALPFLFIPLSAAMYVGLPPAASNEASAIINLMRNLGGSVGISFATTMLQWRTQFHHERLAEHITAATDLHGSTLMQIAHMVQTQASFLSYLDVFRLLGLSALLAWPVVLLLRPVPKGAVPAGH